MSVVAIHFGFRSILRGLILLLLLPDLPMEYNPSDHPRASTIFLSKSQTDGKNNSEPFSPHIVSEEASVNAVEIM